MATERRSLTRPDGRVIEFLVAGPEDGLPLVLHEGTPCGLVLYSADAAGGRGPRPARDPGRPARIRGLDAAARPPGGGLAEDTAAVLEG